MTYSLNLNPRTSAQSILIQSAHNSWDTSVPPAQVLGRLDVNEKQLRMMVTTSNRQIPQLMPIHRRNLGNEGPAEVGSLFRHVFLVSVFTERATVETSPGDKVFRR